MRPYSSFCLFSNQIFLLVSLDYDDDTVNKTLRFVDFKSFFYRQQLAIDSLVTHKCVHIFSGLFFLSLHSVVKQQIICKKSAQ